ncbi:MAG TPA: HNH endonuclease [Chloroflexota bacterium]|nr:HNH endonuclease [Chloroflexota bacterium]
MPKSVLGSSVLVLNQNYEPLNVCPARRAIILIDRGKAEILEQRAASVKSPSHRFPVPSVIRLIYYIRRPRPRVKLSRREIFVRDRFTCQYCGVQSRDLTLDHVLPRHRGGQHSWDNLVSACKGCNHRKANRTPPEARMALARVPKEPPAHSYYVFHQYLQQEEGWLKFIPIQEVAAGA